MDTISAVFPATAKAVEKLMNEGGLDRIVRHPQSDYIWSQSMTLTEFGDMWTTDREHYVLVKTELGSTEHGYLIFDRRSRSAVLIEDDELMNQVLTRMLQAGVPVVDDLPAS